MDTNLIVARWNQFWFPTYSPKFLTRFRIILFTALAFFAWDLWTLNELCTMWKPIGLLRWVNYPCKPEWLLPVRTLTIVFALLTAAGLAWRWTARMTFFLAVVHFGFISCFGAISNSFHMITVAVGLMALSTKHKDPRLSFGWVLQLIKVYVVWVYFVNGLAKLAKGGFQWAFSDNLFLILHANTTETQLARFLYDGKYILTLSAGAAFVMIIAELLAPLALINRKWGALYFFFWLLLHTGVTLLLGGHLHFFSQLFVASVFLPLDKLTLEPFLRSRSAILVG